MMKNLRFVLFLSVACTALALNAGAQESREIRKTVPLKDGGMVSIDTYKGSIDIESWDRMEVDISVRIESDEFSPEDDEKVQDTEILIDVTSSGVRIKTDYDKVKKSHSFWGIFEGDFGNLPMVHYTIKMPVKARLKIKDYKSTTSIGELRSKIDLYTYKGEVEIKDLTGGLELETYKGDCLIRFAKLAERSTFETYKGTIEIVLPSASAFELDADIGKRGSLDSDFTLRSRVRGRNGDDNSYRGSINGGGPLLRLSTYKGEFRLLQR